MRHIYSYLRSLMAASSLLALSATAVQATTYEVGSGQAYTTLSAVPWASLAAGDTVNIHWQPQPYREMILISARGTAAQPVTIQGVADPATGQLPIIDGQNAVQSATLPYHDKNNPISSQSLYLLSPVMVGPPLGNATNNLPQYITIQNLIVRNASQNYSFTNYLGTTTQYPAFATAIYVEGAQHLTIRNCTLTNSGNGLFINSKYGSTGVSSDILIEGNSIYSNGAVNDYHEHNIYTEANGIVFQYNYIGDVMPGALGNALKDRSAGTVIRYNWIGTGGHCIDLVETQGGQGYIDQQSSYQSTFVYGNVIKNPAYGATMLVHYGGDQWDYTYYRRGTLYFYDNTVVTQADQRSYPSQPTDRWSTQLFQLPSQAETGGQAVQEIVDCRNNIIQSISLTPGSTPSTLQMVTTDGTGTLNMSGNWLSPDTQQYHPIYLASFIGTITGWNSNLFGNAQGANDPGFVSPADNNFNLASGSSCIGTGGALPSLEQGIYGAYYQYQAGQMRTLRSGNAAGPDIGAFGYGTPQAVPTYHLSGQVLFQGAGLAGATVSAGSGLVTTTAADGTYSFSGLTPDYYTVSAAAGNYGVSPAQAVALNGDMTGVNFTAFMAYTLTGHVTCHGAGQGGVTVSDGQGHSAITAADGTYTIPGLFAGNYTFGATEAGYTFSSAQTVQLTGNTSGIDFTGTSNTAPAQIISLTLDTYTAHPYNWCTATITLDKTDPMGHASVTMTSSNWNVVQVYDFDMWSPLTTKTCNVIVYSVDTPTDVTITATVGGVSQSVVLTVLPRGM